MGVGSVGSTGSTSPISSTDDTSADALANTKPENTGVAPDDHFVANKAEAKLKNQGLKVRDGEASASSRGNAEYSAYTAKGSTKIGNATVTGQAQLLHAQASESASFKASAKDMSIDGSIKVHVDASLIKANGSIEGEIPVKVGEEQLKVHYNLSAEGGIGLNGDLNLSVHVGADGARVSATASGDVAHASVTARVEIDDDQNRELMGGQVSLKVAAGVGIGIEGGGGLSRTTGKMTDAQKAVNKQWNKGFGTKSWGMDFNGRVALGPATVAWTAEVNPLTVMRDVPKMIAP